LRRIRPAYAKSLMKLWLTLLVASVTEDMVKQCVL
jgi:hypothetical protein